MVPPIERFCFLQLTAKIHANPCIFCDSAHRENNSHEKYAKAGGQKQPLGGEKVDTPITLA
jgi:hypothetical protein